MKNHVVVQLFVLGTSMKELEAGAIQKLKGIYSQVNFVKLLKRLLCMF